MTRLRYLEGSTSEHKTRPACAGRVG